MASTYSTNLKIELQATGENSGTWGTITNTNLGTALEQAIVGYGNPSFASDANLTLTYTDTNAAQAARALVLNVTSSVSLTATRELVVPTIQKQYIVQNNTTGSQSITVKTSAGTGITVPNGRKAHLYVDGTNVIQMFDFVDINGGTIDGTTVGAASASTGAFTTLTASGATTLNGAVALGDAAADLITVPGTVNSNVIFTDNSFDIGASGATRPRTGYFGTSVLSPLVTATNVQVTNVKANDGTAAVTITDSTGAVGVSTAFTLSTATGNIALGTSQTTGTLTAGGTAATGTITVDQSTKTHTLNVGTGATENAATKTVNIATGGVSGSTTTITIGSSNGTSTTLNGTVTAATLNSTTIDTTNLEVTNVKAKDGTAAIVLTDSTGAVTVSTAFTANGGAVFNENGANVDFRVEGDTDANLLFVDASADFVGIGTNTPGSKLQVAGKITADASVAGDVIANLVNSSATGFGLRTVGGASGAGYALSVNNYTGTELLQVNGAGNLGLGVTPSAWNSTKAMQLGLSGAVFGDGQTLNWTAGLAMNAYGVASGASRIWKRISSEPAYLYQMANGGGSAVNGHAWYIGPSGGSAGDTISFTQAMTLDASGNLQLGTTSNYGRMTVAAADDGRIIMVSGTTQGIRLGTNSTGGVIEGVDKTGASSYQPLLLGGADVRFTISGTERMRLDSSGNLGIGTSSPLGKLFVNGADTTSTFPAKSSATIVLNNINGTSNGRSNTILFGGEQGNTNAAAGISFQYTSGTGNGNGALIFGTRDVTTDTAPTERARITSGGEFLVGATSVTTGAKFQIDNANANVILSVGKDIPVSLFSRYNDDPSLYWKSGYPMRFATTTDGVATTGYSEKARITSGGYFKASDAGTYANSTGTYHELRQTANAQAVVVSATNASYTSESISSLVTKTAGTDWLHFYGTSDANTVANIKIFGNGNIQNANGSYGTLSDQKLKQDIVDASSQWNDIKAIRFRKYRIKTDVAANPDSPYLLGVVAQELEQTSPNLVEETEDKIDGGTVKSVKTSVLLMKAAVALQEAMARIETLEAKIAALEAKGA